MESDNLDVLSDCIVSLNGCNSSLANSIHQLDKVLYNNNVNRHDDEFKRLAKITKLKKVYKIYPISYINEQINDYNDIKNNRILSLIETLEKLNELKHKEKENLMNRVELSQNRLEQFVKRGGS